MLRHSRSALSRLLSSAHSNSASTLDSSYFNHLRLFSASAPPKSPAPAFAVGDYLVATCGLTRPQALKASAKLSHLKSPSKPDAVLAFLRGLGLSDADVAVVVAKDPLFLCSSVEGTLAPNVAGLTDLGLSRPEVARLVPIALDKFRKRILCRNLTFLLPICGSFDMLLQALRYCNSLLTADLERKIKPNVELLRDCGIGACEMVSYSIRAGRLLTADTETLRSSVARAQALGVLCGSAMFKRALACVAFQSEDKIAAKMDYLKKTFRWSDAEVRIAVPKLPYLLNSSRERLRRVSEFLISEVGLEPEYIAHRPALVGYSLEGRLRPRHCVLKFLKSNGLLKCDYYSAVMLREKVFVQRYIHPHKEAAPSLAQDYDAACRGEVPTRFVF